jgi:hypothetical protein
MKKLLLTLTIPLALSACGIAQLIPKDLNKEAQAQTNFLEQYQIKQLFSNIVRAAYDEPLLFTSINGLNGDFSNSLSVSPSSTLGNSTMGAITGNIQPISASMSVGDTNSANFNIAALSNSLYQQEFLNQIPLLMVELFFENHHPKTLVHSLLISQISITSADGNVKVYENNPLLLNYPEFQEELYRLIRYGFAPQKISTEEFVGPPISQSRLVKDYGPQYMSYLKRQALTIRQISGGTDPIYQLSKVTTGKPRLCITRNQYEKDVRERYGPGMFCSYSADPKIAAIESSDLKKTTIDFRSNDNVFNFLGAVVRAQLNDPPYLVTLPPPENLNRFRTPITNFALLKVSKNDLLSNNYVQITTIHGNTFSIPYEDAGYSRLSIKLLNQLNKLNNVPGAQTGYMPPLLIRNIK